MTRYLIFCVLWLAMCPAYQAKACSPNLSKVECEFEDVRFLSAQLDEKLVSWRNIFSTPVEPGYRGYYRLNSYKTNGGAVIMLGAFFEDGGLDFTIDKDTPTKDQKWRLRVDADPNYFVFSRHADACGVWEGNYLQVGAGEFASMGSLNFNEDAKLVDEILAEYWNRGISRETARAEILKTKLPEFVSAIDKLDLVRRGEGVVIPAKDFVIHGMVQPAGVPFFEDKNKSAASFEINGAVILKKRKVCVDGRNRLFPKKISLFKRISRSLNNYYNDYKKSKEAFSLE